MLDNTLHKYCTSSELKNAIFNYQIFERILDIQSKLLTYNLYKPYILNLKTGDFHPTLQFFQILTFVYFDLQVGLEPPYACHGLKNWKERDI